MVSTLKEVVISTYLYGTTSIPSDLALSSIIRPDNATSTVTIDGADFMGNGGGRFATASQFEVIQQFFDNNVTIPSGDYTLTGILSQLGLSSVDAKFTVDQKYYPDISDFLERVLIFDLTQFEIVNPGGSAQLKFVVEVDGTRHIENLKIIPKSLDQNGDDNFDLQSSSTATTGLNSVIRPFIDPSDVIHDFGIGRKVWLHFSDNIAPVNSYDSADFALDDAFINSNKSFFDQSLTLGPQMAVLLTQLWNEGITRFLDTEDRPVIYGTNDDDVLKPSDVDRVYDLNHRLIKYGVNAIPDLISYKDNGVALVGGAGDDIITGGDWGDQLLGGADNDFITGGKGDDIIYSGGGINTLLGGEDDDRLYLANDFPNIALGGAGRDEIFAGAAGAILFGSDDEHEGDVLYGGEGNDTVYGGARDFVIGDWDYSSPGAFAGNDLMYVSGIAGQSGTYDALDGGNIGYAEGYGGNDTIIGSDSWIDAGEGNDTVVFDKGVGAVYTGGGENTLIVNPGARVRWEDAEAGTSGHLILGDKAITGTFNAIHFDEGLPGLNIGDGHYLVFVDNRVIIYEALSASEPYERDPNGTLIGFDMGEGFGPGLRDLPELGIAVARNGSGQPLYGGPKYSSIGKHIIDPLSDPSSSTPESKTGTSAADHIQSGSGADTVSAGAGDDVVMTHEGADSVDGGDGNDFIQSDDLDDTVGGADTVSGGNGDDFVQTGAGNDSVNAGSGRDIVEAGSGADVARGYAGNDWLAGEAGVDSLYGGNDADTLNGGAGADYLYGEAGADQFVISDLSHSLYTSAAYDRIADFENGIDVIDLQAFDFHTVTTKSTTSAGELRAYLNSGGTFTYVRSDQSDFFFGIAGNHLASLDDSDFLFGGSAPTFVYGATAADSLSALSVGQALYGLAGNDTLVGGAGDDLLNGGGGVDQLTGGAGADLFRFSAQTHSFTTGSQYDRITDFEDGVDAIDLTGLGFTTLRASGNTQAGELRLTYSSTSNRTLVKSDQVDFSFYLDGDRRADLDNSDFIFGPLVRLSGTSSAEVLTGTASSEGIFGMEGNDTLSGGSGADTLDGGAGLDRLTGGNGADVFKFTDLSHSTGTGSQYDRIVDFENGVDKIDLSGLGFTTLTTSATTASNQLKITYSSGTDRTYIQNGQNNFEFFIDGNVAAALDATDFIFG